MDNPAIIMMIIKIFFIYLIIADLDNNNTKTPEGFFAKQGTNYLLNYFYPNIFDNPALRGNMQKEPRTIKS